MDRRHCRRVCFIIPSYEEGSLLTSDSVFLVVGTLSVLIFLHFRRRRKDRREEARDQFDRDDYGLDPIEHVEPSGPAKYHNIQRPPSSHSNINAPQRNGGQGKDPFEDSIDRPDRSPKMI